MAALVLLEGERSQRAAERPAERYCRDCDTVHVNGANCKAAVALATKEMF